MRRLIDPVWGKAEFAKPFDQRHPLIHWYQKFSRDPAATPTSLGAVGTPTTGVAACYLGLAYSLYLLEHEAELQTRLLRRLEDPAKFQDAYYELIVANILVRAGFTLTLEAVSDPASTRCEFAAVSTRTGKTYRVDAKMRAVPGILGKTAADNEDDSNPVSDLIASLNVALTGPAAGRRLIFIDLNTEPDSATGGKPAWADQVVAYLKQRQTEELLAGRRAYLFVTNMSSHRGLDRPPTVAALPFGLGMRDFDRPAYRWASGLNHHKHIDARHVADLVAKYLRFPQAFDREMRWKTFAQRLNRVRVGETYRVGVGTNARPRVGELTLPAQPGVVLPKDSATPQGSPLSVGEPAVASAERDAGFGKIQPVSLTEEDQFELFEWLVETHRELSRRDLLERLRDTPNFHTLKRASDTELLVAYCEGIVLAS